MARGWLLHLTAIKLCLPLARLLGGCAWLETPPFKSPILPTCRVKGKKMDEVLTIKNSDIAKHLSLPPVKLHCSMLAEDAIKAAVKDLQQKRGKATGAGQQAQAATA